MTVSEPTRMLVSKAANAEGITFDRKTELYKVSPDVYQFSSVRITDECAKTGVCKYERFLAIINGYEVIIQNA